MSIPGMGITSASTILAEIGNFEDFKTGEQLAAYCGQVPSVYQSAGKLITGHITKHGSPHVRRMLIEVAHAISRTKADSRLKRFYFRIKRRHGAKVAIVALARKVICILHHLIVNQETFEDEIANKSKRESLADLPHRQCWLLKTRFRFSLERDTWCKKIRAGRRIDRSILLYRIAFMVNMFPSAQIASRTIDRKEGAVAEYTSGGVTMFFAMYYPDAVYVGTTNVEPPVG